MIEIENETAFTTRSWKSLFVWARQQVARRLTARQRRQMLSRNELRCSVTKRWEADPERTVLSLWALRAGLNDAGVLSIVKGVMAEATKEPPKLVPKSAPRSREKAPDLRTPTQKALDTCRQKIERKKRALAELQTSRHALERRVVAARSALVALGKTEAHLLRKMESTAVAPPQQLSAADLAARMRAKRAEDPAPAVG